MLIVFWKQTELSSSSIPSEAAPEILTAAGPQPASGGNKDIPGVFERTWCVPNSRV